MTLSFVGRVLWWSVVNCTVFSLLVNTVPVSEETAVSVSQQAVVIITHPQTGMWLWQRRQLSQCRKLVAVGAAIKQCSFPDPLCEE